METAVQPRILYYRHYLNITTQFGDDNAVVAFMGSFLGVFIFYKTRSLHVASASHGFLSFRSKSDNQIISDHQIISENQIISDHQNISDLGNLWPLEHFCNLRTAG